MTACEWDWKKVRSTLGSVGIAVQFGNVSQIIQRERIVRIEQVGFVEELLGFVLMMLLECLNALPIKLLNWREFAPLWKPDLEISGMAQRVNGRDH